MELLVLEPRVSWTQTVLGQAIREFATLGWQTDRVPRVISNTEMGFDVRLKKCRVLVMADAKRREVNLCLRAGREILKVRRVEGKPSAAKVVGAVTELLREASV